jgi:tetratricopeptide (TPR) repeat protein
MPHRVLLAAVACLIAPPAGRADEPSWERQTVILARSGIVLQAPKEEKLAPKSAGAAKDLMFQVLKDEDGRLRISSRRQEGWIAKTDAVLFDQAVGYFTKRLAVNGNDVHALTARGLTLATRREQDKALADFNEAIRLDAKATLAYYHRANLAYGRGQYDKALDDYNAVIRLDPEFDWAYHVRGWIYYRKQDYDKARADYETAIKLVPTETVFHRDRGNVAFSRKQYDQAVADYTKSIELDKSYPAPWLQRGRTWAALKEYGKAVADYEQAVKLTEKTPATLYLTTLALFRAGCPDAKHRDGKKALAAAEQAYQRAKGPTELAALAAAYAELGQFDEAVQWQTKAAAAAPAFDKEAQAVRLKLYQDKKPYRWE